MICPKCGSENVSVQAVEDKTVTVHKKGWFYYICIWWWWIFIKLFCKLIMWPVKLLTSMIWRTEKYSPKYISKCVCQNCGHIWEAK